MPVFLPVSSRRWLAALAAALLAAGCTSVDLGAYYEPPAVRMPEPLPPASAPASAALPQPATPQPVSPGQPVGQPLPPLGAGGPDAPATPPAAPASAPTPAAPASAAPVAAPEVHANLFALTTRLEGAAVNPPTRSAGIGRLDAQYDASTGLLQWKASWAGLAGTITGVQFHGPAGMDQNGPPVMIWPAPFGPTYEGRATLTAQQAQDLLAGRWYLNVFTSAYPAGELRGQLRVVR